MPNVEALKKIRDFIANNPEQHNQGHWMAFGAGSDQDFQAGGVSLIQASCNTTGCIAGWACQLNGDSFQIPSWARHGDIVNLDSVTDTDGNEFDIPSRARDLLDLSYAQSSVLFGGDWSHEQSLEMLDGLIEKGDIPEGYYESDDDNYCDCDSCR